MEDAAINCYCCKLEEDSKYAAESITADRLNPSLPLDAWQCSQEKSEPLRDADSAAEPQTRISGNFQSAPASESIEDGRKPSTKPLMLTFSRPNGQHEDVYFKSRPLGLRFSDTAPLTVTHVSSDYANGVRVNLGWVVTHVNKVPVPRYILDANEMVRDAVSQLPCDARSTQKKAIIPDKYQRPQPIPEAEEEGWSSLIEAAAARMHRRKLKALQRRMQQVPSLLKLLAARKMKEWEEKKSAEAVRTLDATAESIRALKKDFQKRAQACNGSLPKFLSDAETLVLQRLTAAHSLVGSHDRLVGLRTNVANACIEAEQLRGRQLEELRSSVVGGFKDAMSVQSTKQVITTAMKLADQAWREAVQFAAETLDGPLFVGCEDVI
eukprot:s1285_g4.t1